ncbi:MAG: 2'-deoxycytidine 5'-triphosphate deaminase, partial [Actinomycetota bacterium]
VHGRANPKSSTGRLDVFTRVITDRGSTFDDIAPGYEGRLYLEVVPLSFTVRVREDLSLNQLRLVRGAPRLATADIRAMHAEAAVLFHEGAPVAEGDLPLRQGGLFLSLRLGEGPDPVGYRAKRFSRLVDMSRLDHDPTRFWEEVGREQGGIVLEPGDFYLLMSAEAVSVPPGVAAEMAAYDPTSGELRSHYAGFFDPGFGYSDIDNRGSTAALEVRAHDVPFLIEEGQPVCKLVFERMAEEPKQLYGGDIGSSYQDQATTLGKHFLGTRGTQLTLGGPGGR